MNHLSTKDSLLEQIEVLRTQLHEKVKKDTFNLERLHDDDLLQISRKLDDLIVKYMSLKKM